jgi:hypothetical protein
MQLNNDTTTSHNSTISESDIVPIPKPKINTNITFSKNHNSILIHDGNSILFTIKYACKYHQIEEVLKETLFKLGEKRFKEVAAGYENLNYLYE